MRSGRAPEQDDERARARRGGSGRLNNWTGAWWHRRCRPRRHRAIGCRCKAACQEDRPEIHGHRLLRGSAKRLQAFKQAESPEAGHDGRLNEVPRHRIALKGRAVDGEYVQSVRASFAPYGLRPITAPFAPGASNQTVSMWRNPASSSHAESPSIRLVCSYDTFRLDQHVEAHQRSRRRSALFVIDEKLADDDSAAAKQSLEGPAQQGAFFASSQSCRIIDRRCRSPGISEQSTARSRG